MVRRFVLLAYVLAEMVLSEFGRRTVLGWKMKAGRGA